MLRRAATAAARPLARTGWPSQLPQTQACGYHKNVRPCARALCDSARRATLWRHHLLSSARRRGLTPSLQVVDHYEKPRNVGSFDKSDPNVGTGLVGAPACGDVMKLQIKARALLHLSAAARATRSRGRGLECPRRQWGAQAAHAASG